MITIGNVTSDTAQDAAAAWVAQFSEFREDGTVPAPDLETVRAAAILLVRQRAQAEENAIDNLVAGNVVRAIMLNTEIVQYYNDGRPASPAAGVYAIAAAIATRRGANLRDTLESLFSRWLTIRGRIATITTELDRLEDEIAAAATIGEIETILAGMNWG